MNYIVLRPNHITAIKQAVRDYMTTTKWGTWKNYIEDKTIREDFEPIRIMDDATGQRWVLPLSVRDNPKFQKLKEIIQSGEITGITIQDLTKADLPEYSLDGDTNYNYEQK